MVAVLLSWKGGQPLSALRLELFSKQIFLYVCIFSHILTFLKMPWPKAIKTLYYSAEIRGLYRLGDPNGFLLAARERRRTTAPQYSALECWLDAEGKFSLPWPQATHWGSRERPFTKE